MSEKKSETKELTCIGCPLGCTVTVTMTDGSVTGVTGNTCPRGDAYARKEVTNPTRIVTSTVRVTGGTSPMVNVKTATDIPKDKIFACIAAIRDITVTAPVHIGDVIAANVADTGVDMIAAKSIAVRE
jgi:CxxC motif-containing protein